MSQPMQIESLEIKNYRLFKDVKFSDLARLTVVVGANGSGKSTLFDVFSFLKEALTQNVATAVTRRGGFNELVSRGEKGPIAITVKFRESGGRLATYDLHIGVDGGRVVVEREVLKIRRGQNGKPLRFVDFTRGRGKAITKEPAYGDGGAIEVLKYYELDDPSVLAIKGLGQFREFRLVSELRSHIESWYVSDFHIADARPSMEAGEAEHLSTRGENVAQVAQYLYEHHRDRFDKVLDAMKRRVPGVAGVEARPTEDGRLVLRFKDGSFKDPFIARYVSDGTIKMFAYLVLLYDPKPFPLLAVEEPENQLYPELMIELIEEFRVYAERGGQVFVSTHSPDFLNGARLEEIFWLVKNDGFTNVRRASDDPQLVRLVEEGDLPGALWKQGLFEGAHPR
ncbi:AAA family ATPase [Methylosinus sp. KRF6]|uniref:AAA family ATPase n=1 Tax=Methylosinus sp. KRF6 TaxID=2846853 RepID=UPI001C0D6046|nr:AAA family ATPase [Methylosinus sp. KRF6]MBU3886919.1 AAA family ATPase [Methylosinus sp. KRF6]